MTISLKSCHAVVTEGAGRYLMYICMSTKQVLSFYTDFKDM
jgi:hypothetical protein